MYCLHTRKEGNMVDWSQGQMGHLLLPATLYFFLQEKSIFYCKCVCVVVFFLRLSLMPCVSWLKGREKHDVICVSLVSSVSLPIYISPAWLLLVQHGPCTTTIHYRAFASTQILRLVTFGRKLIKWGWWWWSQAQDHYNDHGQPYAIPNQFVGKSRV